MLCCCVCVLWEPAWDAIPHFLTLIWCQWCTGTVCSGCSPVALNTYHEKEKYCINVVKWITGSSFLLCNQLRSLTFPEKAKLKIFIIRKTKTCPNTCRKPDLFFQFFFFSSLFLCTGADFCWRWVVGGSPREGGSPWRGRSVHRNFWAPGKMPQTTFILLYLTSRVLRSAHVQKMSLDTH